jgi:hypothetical protein
LFFVKHLDYGSGRQKAVRNVPNVAGALNPLGARIACHDGYPVRRGYKCKYVNDIEMLDRTKQIP